MYGRGAWTPPSRHPFKSNTPCTAPRFAHVLAGTQLYPRLPDSAIHDSNASRLTANGEPQHLAFYLSVSLDGPPFISCLFSKCNKVFEVASTYQQTNRSIWILLSSATRSSGHLTLRPHAKHAFKPVYDATSPSFWPQWAGVRPPVKKCKL